VTYVEQRPDGGCRGAVADRGRSSTDDTGPPGRLDDPELLAEVGRVVAPAIAAARREHGQLAGVATEQWWAASDDVKLAGILVLGMAWCLHDPDRVVRERLREMSWDMSAGLDWAAASRRPTPDTLRSRRERPGPMLRTVDPVAAARWARTGSSAGGPT